MLKDQVVPTQRNNIVDNQKKRYIPIRVVKIRKGIVIKVVSNQEQNELKNERKVQERLSDESFGYKSY